MDQLGASMDGSMTKRGFFKNFSLRVVAGSLGNDHTFFRNQAVSDVNFARVPQGSMHMSSLLAPSSQVPALILTAKGIINT